MLQRGILQVSHVVSTWSCWAAGGGGGPQSFYDSWSDSAIRMSDSKIMCLDVITLNGGPIQVGAALQLYDCTVCVSALSMTLWVVRVSGQTVVLCEAG